MNNVIAAERWYRHLLSRLARLLQSLA